MLTLGVAAGCIVGVVLAARWYLGGAEQRTAEAACAGVAGATHKVDIRSGSAQPESIVASRCDRLVLINHDEARRRLAFGEHSHHVDYDGADGRLMGQGESLTLILSETGDFMFHDHFDESVHGHFTVQ